MKQITIIGHLGDDAKMTLNEDYNLMMLSVATSESSKNANGEKTITTDWFTIFKKYKKSPSGLLEYLKKGSQICVSGNISFKQIQAENGNIYFNKTINADIIHLIFDKKESE